MSRLKQLGDEYVQISPLADVLYVRFCPCPALQKCWIRRGTKHDSWITEMHMQYSEFAHAKAVNTTFKECPAAATEMGIIWAIMFIHGMDSLSP